MEEKAFMIPRNPTAAAGDIADAAMAQTTPALQGVSIQHHESDVPPFVEPALKRLYGNLFSSLAHFRVFGGMENASTYVVRDGAAIICVWLFRREKNHVQVLNEGMPIDGEEVERFARHIFAVYGAVNVISFHAVRVRTGRLRLPHQRFNCLEDMVLSLPPTPADYFASLGKATRSYIHRYLNKLKRDFPDFHYSVVETQNIEDGQIRRIIELNRSRMAGKGKVAINDDDATQRIIRLARECGMVGVLMLGGRLCAGTINYRVGDNYFLDVIAHDPAYNDYRLGTLCCYLTVCACIERGGHEYHLLWGRDEYKTRLLAVPQDLDDLIVFRSRMYLLCNGNRVLKSACNAGTRGTKLWLRKAQRRNSVVARLVLAVARSLRLIA